MGPSLNAEYPYGTTENVLYWQRPYYGAEQTLFNLAYNIHMLKYLRWTAQLTNPVMINALEYCNSAIQRALSNYNGTTGFFYLFSEFIFSYQPLIIMDASTPKYSIYAFSII